MSKDFREGDNLFHKEFGECEFIKHSLEVGVSLVRWLDVTLNKEVLTKDLYHDHDRKISAAVQKAIEENETKPVRKVRRWINCYIDFKGQERFKIHNSKQDAEDHLNIYSDLKFVIEAHEIEIEEDKL